MIMYKIVLLLFSLTIISCNNRNDKNQIVEKVNKVAVDSILNLPPDKKLFLDFATGISEAQFNVLINLLRENKKIDTDGYYQIYLNEKISLKSLINPTFENDKLFEITLSIATNDSILLEYRNLVSDYSKHYGHIIRLRDAELLYEFYKKKYGEPVYNVTTIFGTTWTSWKNVNKNISIQSDESSTIQYVMKDKYLKKIKDHPDYVKLIFSESPRKDKRFEAKRFINGYIYMNVIYSDIQYLQRIKDRELKKSYQIKQDSIYQRMEIQNKQNKTLKDI